MESEKEKMGTGRLYDANYDTEFVLINVAGTSKVRVTDARLAKSCVIP